MMNIDKEQAIKDLKNGVCKVVFTKANGDNRVMHCTLNESILPAQKDIEEEIQKKKPNPNALAVWDTDNGGWRSFRWDSIKEFKTEFNL
jgi:hypothetical protein